MAILLEKVLNKKTDDFYSPGNGQYSFEFASRNLDDYSEWYSCREQFHEDYCEINPKLGNFYYTLYFNQKIKDIVKTLSFYEKKLKIAPIKIQKIKAIDYDKEFKYECFLFKLPYFWRDPIRHNLLTLIIRESPKIHGQLLKTTKNAVDLFLKGHVYYWSDQFKGWVDEFGGKDNNEAKEKLHKKPSPNKKLEYFFDHDGVSFDVKKH